MSKQQKAYIFALSAIVLWSTAATAFKLALREMDFIQLLFVASVVSWLILALVLVFQKKTSHIFRFSAKEYLFSAFLGLFNPFGFYMVLLKAYSVLPAQIAQPLNYTWPLVLVLFSAPILKQKLTAKSIFALVVSFSGVFVISTQGSLQSLEIKQPLGVVLAMGSSVIWALFWLLNVRDKREEIIKLFLNFSFGTLYILVALLVWSEPVFRLSGSFAAAVYVGFFEMGFTFILWLKALKMSSSADKISNFVYLSPFLALIFIHYFLGEAIYYTTFAGVFLIVGGIVIQQVKFRKKK